MKAKMLLPWQMTDLGTKKNDFSLYVVIYDNLTDEHGEIPYHKYPLVKLNFENGFVKSFIVLQEGVYAIPEFEGWHKDRVKAWLDDYDERSHWVELNHRWGYEFEIYRSVVEIK